MRWIPSTVTLLVLLVLAACGGKKAGDEPAHGETPPAAEAPAAPATPAAAPTSAPYCDAPRVGVATYAEERGGMTGRFVRHAARPVAMLCPGDCEDLAAVDAAEVCTGVLIASDLLLTTRSCLGESAATPHGEVRRVALAKKAVFGWVADAEGAAPSREDVDVRDVTELVESGIGDGFDYAILRVADTPGLRWGQVRLERPNPQQRAMTPRSIPDGRLLLSHQGGQPLQFSQGAFRVVTSGMEPVYLSGDAGARGGALFDLRTRLLSGVLVAGGDCAAGQPGQAMTVDALLDASRILKNLVTIYARGNRTTHGRVELRCGSRSCIHDAADCGGSPCCDEDGDGTEDVPAQCWETLEQGCSIDCPKNRPVAWSCGTDSDRADRDIEFVKDGDGEMLMDDCGDACSGEVTRAAGFEVRCHFLD